MNESFIPITMFISLFGIVAVVMFFRFRSRQELQLTVRSAIESGQPMSAELLAELSAALQPQQNDIRRGVVLIAIGAATVVLANLIPDTQVRSVFMGLSAFPFFVGIAYVIMSRLGAKTGEQQA